MPTVHEGGDSGYRLVSRRHGRFINHQLTPQGVSLVQEYLGRRDVIGGEISVEFLLELKRDGHAYTLNQKRRAEKRRQASSYVPPSTAFVPPAAPPPRFVSPSPPAAHPPVVQCPACSSLVVNNAVFCARCGTQIASGMRPRQHPSATARLNSAETREVSDGIVILIVLLAVACVGAFAWIYFNAR